MENGRGTSQFARGASQFAGGVSQFARARRNSPGGAMENGRGVSQLAGVESQSWSRASQRTKFVLHERDAESPRSRGRSALGRACPRGDGRLEKARPSGCPPLSDPEPLRGLRMAMAPMPELLLDSLHKKDLQERLVGDIALVGKDLQILNQRLWETERDRPSRRPQVGKRGKLGSPHPPSWKCTTNVYRVNTSRRKHASAEVSPPSCLSPYQGGAPATDGRRGRCRSARLDASTGCGPAPASGPLHRLGCPRRAGWRSLPGDRRT
jgi:hypothetical protein